MSDEGTAWSRSVDYAAGIFSALDCATRANGVLTRQPYGDGEQTAHGLIANAGDDLQLASQVDAAGNLHLTFPGRDRSAPGWFTGSHLDSVPDGGNFDGAAGVVAGLAIMHSWRYRGIVPHHDVTLLALRGEEGSSWFTGEHGSHFGSRALLGQLPAAELQLARSLTDGRCLADWVNEAGFDAQRIKQGAPLIPIQNIGGFVELHIEQGPVLVNQAYSVGIVTGIRGSLRVRSARCLGQNAHSGAVPREYRRDALFGAAAFAMALECQWEQWLGEGRDVVCTIGRFGTDPAQHSMTKIAGEVQFSIDIRTLDQSLLHKAQQFLMELAEQISVERKLNIQLGPLDIAVPALMSQSLQTELRRQANDLGLRTQMIASGAGHDTANFAAAGVPTAMIFVRNDHGSHNRDEAMEMDDFADGAQLLGGLLESN